MTTTVLPQRETVTIEDDRIVINHLTIVNGEAAALLRSTQERGGPQAAETLLSRAVPVGLLALSMGSASTDSGAVSRTLDAFADQIQARSQQTLEGLDATLAQLQQGEQAVSQTALGVLERLPAQVQAALGGEAANVRAAVTEATRAAQAAGMTEIREALQLHSSAVRDAMSLDREGPVAALRRDLLDGLNTTRQELSEHLTVVRGMLQAAEAHKNASMKSTRSVGIAWEIQAVAIARQVVTAAGDYLEATGSRAAPGGTSKVGDAVATVSRAITGPGGHEIRLLIEAKQRSKPMTSRAFKDELANGRRVRQCAGGLALVPTCAEVPGGGRFAKVDELSWVVAADDLEIVSLCYLTLRELVLLVTVRQSDGDDLDLVRLEGQLNLGLASLQEFDEVARLASAAQKNLDNLKLVGGRAKTKIHEALANSLKVLHP